MSRTSKFLIISIVCLALALVSFGMISLGAKNKLIVDANLTETQLIARLDNLTGSNIVLEELNQYYLEQLNKAQLTIEELRNELEENKTLLEDLKENESISQETINKLNSQINELNALIAEKDATIEELNAVIVNNEKVISDLNITIEGLVEQLNSGNELFQKVVSGEITELKAEDFGNITAIRDYAFYGCSKLTNVEFPETLQTIGSNAFYKCNSLNNVVIPSGVTKIGQVAFYSCTNLKDVRLTSTTPPTLDTNALSRPTLTYLLAPAEAINAYMTQSSYYATIWTGYETFEQGSSLPNYADMINYDTTTWYSDKECTQAVTEISTSGEYYCRVTKVGLDFTIVDGIVTAYTGKSNSLVIPATYSINENGITVEGTDYAVTGIGKECFMGFNGEVILPEGIKSIGNQCFYGSYLTNVTLPSTIEEIGSNAFYGSPNLTEITILATTPPSFLTLLGIKRPFPDSLEKIYIPNGSLSAYQAAGTAPGFLGNPPAGDWYPYLDLLVELPA